MIIENEDVFREWLWNPKRDPDKPYALGLFTLDGGIKVLGGLCPSTFEHSELKTALNSFNAVSVKILSIECSKEYISCTSDISLSN